MSVVCRHVRCLCEVSGERRQIEFVQGDCVGVVIDQLQHGCRGRCGRHRRSLADCRFVAIEIALQLIPGAAEVHEVRDDVENQRDNLCGCFWAWVALRAFDHSTLPDEEPVAMAAGCVVPDGPTRPEFSLPWGGTGVTASWPYREPLPTSDDDDAVGTSAHGVARAVELLSDGRVVAVPLRAQRWTAGLVTDLVSRLVAFGRPVLPVANVATKPFIGSTVSSAAVMQHLLTGAGLPTVAADWDVGHFCSIAGVLKGPAAELVVIRDTYRAMGWRGHHVQTYQSLADALDRGGTGAGGVLVLCHRPAAPDVLLAVDGLGLVDELWDNGSPRP